MNSARFGAVALALTVAFATGCENEPPAPAPDSSGTGGRGFDPGTGGAPGSGGVAGDSDAGGGDGAAGDAAAEVSNVDLAAPPDSASDAAGDAGASAFVEVACGGKLAPALEARYRLRCGRVSVPEDPARPAGRSVQIALLIASARDAPPRFPDPLVYLAGGPGGSGVTTVGGAFEIFAPFIDDGREVIGVDHRGVGASRPGLACPSGDLAACKAMHAPNLDLDRLNSLSNADDLEAIRRALGYPAWNLVGISYGTRTALESLRRHPAGVRSVILDSVVPPDLNLLATGGPDFLRTLQEIEGACMRHPVCGKVYPPFLANVLAVAGAPAYDFSTPEGRRTVVGAEALGLIRGLAYSVDRLRELPEIVESLRARDEKMFRRFFGGQGGGGSSELVYRTVVCNEMSPIPVLPETAAAIDRLDPLLQPASRNRSYAQQLCPAWGTRQVGPEIFQPVTSDIPALVLSGHFDPATPPSNAVRVAATLSRSSNHVVGFAGHGTVPLPCVLPAARAFVGNPSAPVTWQCPTGTPAIAFTIPATRQPRGLLAKARSTPEDVAGLRRLLDDVLVPPTAW